MEGAKPALCFRVGRKNLTTMMIFFFFVWVRKSVSRRRRRRRRLHLRCTKGGGGGGGGITTKERSRAESQKSSLSLSSVCLSLILWHFLVVPLDFPSALPVRILPPAPSDDAKREPDERLFRHVHVLRHAVVHRLTHSSSSSSFGTQKCVCVSTQNFCKRENVCRRRTDDGRQKRKKKRVLNPNRPSFGDACFDLD